MSIFASAIFTIFKSKLILSMLACAVPFLAVSTLCSILHSGGDVS
jgi:hypothetical protein